MMADPEFRKEYDALGEEFALIEAMIEARTQANMTQADVAKAMGVSQPRVARIESGKMSPWRRCGATPRRPAAGSKLALNRSKRNSANCGNDSTVCPMPFCTPPSRGGR
jgi:DNA-binding XRE family transcriptional regulator